MVRIILSNGKEIEYHYATTWNTGERCIYIKKEGDVIATVPLDSLVDFNTGVQRARYLDEASTCSCLIRAVC